MIDDELEKLFDSNQNGLSKSLQQHQRTLTEAMRQMTTQQAQQQNNYGSLGQPYARAVEGKLPYSPMEKLMMRLNIPRDQTHPFEFMQVHMNPSKENVLVFIVKDGVALTLEDEIPLFPSDSLLGKINLLRA